MSASLTARPPSLASAAKVVDLRRPQATASSTWRSSAPAARSASLTAALTHCSAASSSITTPALRPREGCCPTPSTSTSALGPLRTAVTIAHTVLLVPMSKSPRRCGVCLRNLCLGPTHAPFKFQALPLLQPIRRRALRDGGRGQLSLAGAGQFAHHRPAGRAHVDLGAG